MLGLGLNLKQDARFRPTSAQVSVYLLTYTCIFIKRLQSQPSPGEFSFMMLGNFLVWPLLFDQISRRDLIQ